MAVLLVETTPVGPLTLEVEGSALTGVRFGRHGVPAPGQPEESALLDRAAAQIGEYFAGTRTVFDLPMAPSGTPFQLGVWARLREIPYGQTISYGELARRVGNAKASRAVGLANGRNPISIVVPCHRVIGADGTLTGFGGGMTAKQTLLDLERGALF